MPDGDGYLAAAYLVFLALVLIYVAIMALRLGRLQRELGELVEALDRDGASARDREQEPTAA